MVRFFYFFDNLVFCDFIKLITDWLFLYISKKLCFAFGNTIKENLSWLGCVCNISNRFASSFVNVFLSFSPAIIVMFVPHLFIKSGLN